MEIIIICTVENTDSYMGKNGFGSNITVSQLVNKRRKTLTFSVKDKNVFEKFEECLQTQVTLKLSLDQSNFGLRIGDVLELLPASKIEK